MLKTHGVKIDELSMLIDPSLITGVTTGARMDEYVRGKVLRW